MARTSITTSATVGFEDTLWLVADKLSANVDASEYKHVVLGLVFLKCISDSFDALHTDLVAEGCRGAALEYRDDAPG